MKPVQWHAPCPARPTHSQYPQRRRSCLGRAPTSANCPACGHRAVAPAARDRSRLAERWLRRLALCGAEADNAQGRGIVRCLAGEDALVTAGVCAVCSLSCNTHRGLPGRRAESGHRRRAKQESAPSPQADIETGHQGLALGGVAWPLAVGPLWRGKRAEADFGRPSLSTSAAHRLTCSCVRAALHAGTCRGGTRQPIRPRIGRLTAGSV